MDNIEHQPHPGPSIPPWWKPRSAETVLCYWGNKEFELPKECVLDCSQPGSNDESVCHWQARVALNYWTRGEIIRELLEYGAWDKEELDALNDDELEQKVLWLACHDAKEEMYNRESD